MTCSTLRLLLVCLCSLYHLLSLVCFIINVPNDQAYQLLVKQLLTNLCTGRLTFVGQGEVGKTSAIRTITNGLGSAYTVNVFVGNDNIYPSETYVETASTCGIARCDVKTVHGDSWKQTKNADSVILMQRQLVPRCRVCQKRLKLGATICASCASKASVGLPPCTCCCMLGVA